MWWVDAKTGTKIKPLSIRGTAALKAWWNNTASPAEVENALNEIMSVHREGHWIGCDCIEGAELPVMSPALRGETYFLRRLTTRAHHLPTCTFNFEQIMADRESANPSPGIGEFGAPPDFGPKELGKKITTQERHTEIENKGSRGTPVPGIAKRLWWLMHASGNQQVPFANAIPKLMELAKTLPFGDSNLSLKEVLFYGTRGVDEGWIDTSLARQSNILENPTCWLLLEIIDCNLKDKTITVLSFASSEKIIYKIDGAIRIWGGDVSPARFPMLAFAKIEGGKTAKRIVEIYAQPIYKPTRWLLLDSNNERETLKDLISVGKWLQNEKGINSFIEKPLFEWKRTGEKPDFVLNVFDASGNIQPCVIETMGYSDMEYIQRKEALSKNLNQHTDVIMDYRQQNKNASKELKSQVAKWALKAGRLR